MFETCINILIRTVSLLAVVAAASHLRARGDWIGGRRRERLCDQISVDHAEALMRKVVASIIACCHITRGIDVVSIVHSGAVEISRKITMFTENM